MPSGIGHQDLAALLARQPAVTERWRQHVRHSAFRTMHAATFSFPRPMGAAIPDPYFTQLASLDPRALEVTGSVPLHAPIEPSIVAPRLDFPVVDRRMKGDKLTVQEAPQPAASAPSAMPAARKGDRSPHASTATQDDAALVRAASAVLLGAEAVRASALPDRQPTLRGPIHVEARVETPAAEAPPLPIVPVVPDAAPQPAADSPSPADDEPKHPDAAVVDIRPPAPRSDVVDRLDQLASSRQPERLFFGTHEIGFGGTGLQPWQPDEAPIVLAAPHVDPEIKRAARDPLPDAQSETPGETVAPKGEVTGEGRRPRTPAERLNLAGAERTRHEKCLANAIYFEARGEVERGQMAVAQVILNRAFSGYYPGNVCDVVYQNAHRHLACQFTFACDNVRDVVRDPPRWEIATRIARDALDGKFWLPEIGKATHYHATYVNPWWVRTMTKHARLGVHIFYRPTRWGALEEIPVWGDRLETTGSIRQPPSDKGGEKRAQAQPAARRSIFDPVEEIEPGG